MPQYIYRVEAIETVECVDSSVRYARLEAVGDVDGLSRSLRLKMPDAQLGDYVVLTTSYLSDTEIQSFGHMAKIGRRLHFLHHYDRPNQGDVLSGPYRYFDFGDYARISWDKQILKGEQIPFRNGDTIVIGGGIFFMRDKPRLNKLLARAGDVIGWGIGIDQRLDPATEVVSHFSLVGTRERSCELIDNRKVFYVPCVSCMHEVFSFTSGEGDGIALHLNGGFNEKTIRTTFPGVRETTTVSPFVEIIDNLRSAYCLVTNSYHGAYWGSLLGKRVICVATRIPKWSGLHPAVVVVSDVGEALAAVDKAKPVPAEYREECRNLNQAFYNRVMARLNDKRVV